MTDWMQAIDEVVAHLGDPKVAVTQPQRLEGEMGVFRRRCWVWFGGTASRVINVDHYGRWWEFQANNHEAASVTLNTRTEPTKEQARTALHLADGFLP